MPRAQLKAVRLAARTVREAVFSLAHVLEEGFEQQLVEVGLVPDFAADHPPAICFLL